jgi:6-pyruvoyl-tetrahydropterin synthase
MRYIASASVSFGAGHSLGLESWCGIHAHGHSYQVTVSWIREGFAATDLDAWMLNRQRLLDLALELKNRDLAKMLGAQVPNVFGVASFFMERLSLNINVTRVEVREDNDPVAIIERDTDY